MEPKELAHHVFEEMCGIRAELIKNVELELSRVGNVKDSDKVLRVTLTMALNTLKRVSRLKSAEVSDDVHYYLPVMLTDEQLVDINFSKPFCTELTALMRAEWNIDTRVDLVNGVCVLTSCGLKSELVNRWALEKVTKAERSCLEIRDGKVYSPYRAAMKRAQEEVINLKNSRNRLAEELERELHTSDGWGDLLLEDRQKWVALLKGDIHYLGITPMSVYTHVDWPSGKNRPRKAVVKGFVGELKQGLAREGIYLPLTNSTGSLIKLPTLPLCVMEVLGLKTLTEQEMVQCGAINPRKEAKETLKVIERVRSEWIIQEEETLRKCIDILSISPGSRIGVGLHKRLSLLKLENLNDGSVEWAYYALCTNISEHKLGPKLQNIYYHHLIRLLRKAWHRNCELMEVDKTILLWLPNLGECFMRDVYLEKVDLGRN